MTDKKSKLPNIRINKVYTRTGDKGKTRLVGGVERYKDDPRVEAYGSVDELNSHIGLCRDLLRQTGREDFGDLISYLKIIQNELFNLGTQLAATDDARLAYVMLPCIRSGWQTAGFRVQSEMNRERPF